MLSCAQYGQAKNNLAYDNLWRCIDLHIEEYQHHDLGTLRYLALLEEWLVEWRRYEEATEIAARRAQILGPPEIPELLSEEDDNCMMDGADV